MSLRVSTSSPLIERRTRTTMEPPRKDPPLFPRKVGGQPEASSVFPTYILTAFFLFLVSWWWLFSQRPRKENDPTDSGAGSGSTRSLSPEAKRMMRERMALAASARQQQQCDDASMASEASPSPTKNSETTVSSSAGENKSKDENDGKKPFKADDCKSPLSVVDKKLPEKEQQYPQNVSSTESKIIPNSSNDTTTKILTSSTNLESRSTENKNDAVPAPTTKRKDDSLADDDNKSKKKSKKRALMLHPSQAFVEAISKVTHCPVQMDKYTSRKNPKLPSSGLILRLDCIVAHENIDDAMTTTTELWPILNSGLQALLLQDSDNPKSSTTSSNNPFKKILRTVRDSSQWHRRAEEIVRDSASSSASNEQNDHIVAIMKLLQVFAANSAQQWIVNELPQLSSGMMNQEGSSEFDDLGLFSDDYAADNSQSFGSTAGTTSIQESGNMAQLCLLLEESNPPTVSFLRSVINGRNDIAQGLWDTLMARSQSLMPHNELLARRITAVSQAIQQSHDLCQIVANSFQDLVGGDGAKELTGKEWEKLVSMQPLLRMAAYTVPEVGDETQINRHGRTKSQSLFRMQFEQLPNYPLCVFSTDSATYKDVAKVLDQSKHLMRIAAVAAEAAFRKAFKILDKGAIFRWLASLYQVNEALASMIQADLLSSEGFWAVAASRSFLLGTTSSVLSFCCQSLQKRYKKIGTDAFDSRYLDSNYHGGSGPLKVLPSERKLLKSSHGNERASSSTTTFSGSTEFFFLVSGLLRVSVFASLRTQREFESRYNQILNQLSQASSEVKTNQNAPENLIAAGKPVVAAWLGLKTFLEEQSLAANITSFCILQLEWLVALSKENKGAKFADIPDWMCRQPAHWLSHVARTMPHVLNPLQGGLVVEFAIELLQFGTGAGSHEAPFSPLVMTELIGIAASFVSAGVRKAKRRNQRGRGFHSSNSEQNDDRSLNIYTSLDKSDLGVTVFTNERVQSGLCPTLMLTFSALDIVEGLDVDRDSFDKFSVKTQIADLLLRVMGHPSGQFRESCFSLDHVQLAKFASSVAAAIGYLMDDGFHRLTDVVSLTKKRRLSHTDQSFLRSQQKGATNCMAMARTQLLLLFQLSEDPRFAAVAGGYQTNEAAKKLSAMVLHFLFVMTEQDGGTSKSLDMRLESSESTLSLAARLSGLLNGVQEQLVNDLVSRRRHSRDEYGFDASCLSHLMLALCARWHGSYIQKAGKGTINSSPFVNYLASNDDCDLHHIQNIHRRLVECATSVGNVSVTNRFAVFESDGHTLEQAIPGYKDAHDVIENPEVKHRRKSAKRDQLSHGDMGKIADKQSITIFLNDLSSAFQKVAAKTNLPKAEDIARIEKKILRLEGEEFLEEDDYQQSLEDWAISSDSFLSASEPDKFIHYYDLAARGKSLSGGGALMREAKRIKKTLPKPHPDGAIFVCFEERRMDLCRAIMTGPIDTPYSLGMFTFDVFFPAIYPMAPPLVTFMTTGGGQTRFNPNLYQDGK